MHYNVSIVLLVVLSAAVLIARCDAHHTLGQTTCAAPASSPERSAQPVDLGQPNGRVFSGHCQPGPPSHEARRLHALEAATRKAGQP